LLRSGKKINLFFMPLSPVPNEGNSLVVILVVENQADVRNKIVTDLAGQWSLRLAATAAEAELILGQEPVHLVLLGLPMGSIEGGRVLQKVKMIDEHIEIVVLAAFETKESARQAIRQGACDYISKTAEPNILRAAVARAVRLRDLFDREASHHARLSNLTQQLNDTVIREEIARNNNLGYAGVLHDIVNPLTVASGFLEAMQKTIADQTTLSAKMLEPMKRELALISKQVFLCCSITSRYMRILRHQYDQAGECSVNRTLNDLQVIVAHHRELKHNPLEIQELQENHTVLIGSTELLPALLNLTINAVQSSAPAKPVIVSAEPIPLAPDPDTLQDGPQDVYWGRATFDASPPTVAIRVIDQGRGIPANILAHIFEPHFSTKGEKGNGLGLPIVARLVEVHHALMHVHTEVGAGTTVTLYLPARVLLRSDSMQPFAIRPV